MRAGKLGFCVLGLVFFLGFSALGPYPAFADGNEGEAVKKVQVKKRGTVRKASVRKAPRRGGVFASGNGSQKNPWTIRTAAQLEAFARSVNQGNSYAGKRIRLTADIDLSGRQWTPIGFYRDKARRPFKGAFDGNGRVVSGLRIEAPAAGMAGLFGVLEGATVQGLTVEDASVSGGANVGIVAGFALRSELRNCSVSGTVQGLENAGGLVGQASECRMTGLSFSGLVKSSASSVGGVVGSMFGTLLSRAEVRGEVMGLDNVGGLAGSIREGELKEVGTRDLEVNGRNEVGGLVGFASDSAVLRRSRFDGVVSGKGNTGGLIGWLESGTLTDCSVSGSVLGWERTGGASGLWSDGIARRCSVDALVSGTSEVGGFAGRMAKGTADRCESRGSVEGGNAVGGLVGSLGSGKLEKCAVSGGVKGVLVSGREVGKTDR